MASLEYPGYRTPYYELGNQMLSMAQPISPDSKTISSLVVQEKIKPLSCNMQEDIFIQYTVVGESQGSVDVTYLVSGGVTTLYGKCLMCIYDKEPHVW